MITTKKELKEVLKIEKNKYELNVVKTIFGFFGLSERGIIWRYQKNLRKYEFHLNSGHVLRSRLFQMIVNKIGFKYGFIIEPNSVDVGMRICHLGSILIRGKIGKNAVIHINTALVGGGTVDEAPVCGDDLYLGIGSIIVGPIVIGDDVCVAAGAVVTKNVNSHCTVGGVPAIPIKDVGPRKWHQKN